MIDENDNEKCQQLDLIQKQLKTLNTNELSQMSYLLSLYQDASLTDLPNTIPMHFLGRFLGIKHNPDGTAEMKLGLQNENTFGVAQVGSIYTLADVAIGFSILKNLSQGEKVFTLELKINFIEKGQGSYLVATPSILRQGKKMVVSECSITDEKGKLIAKALGTFYIAKG